MSSLNELIIEDDPDLAASLEILLKLESMRVARADSGESGLDRARGAEFDICFVDFRLGVAQREILNGDDAR